MSLKDVPGTLDQEFKWSNRISWGRPGDVGGERPRDVLETNICRLGNILLLKHKFPLPWKMVFCLMDQ